MPIKTGTIKTSALIAVSGGTDVSLLSRGGSLGTIKVILDDGSEYLNQTAMDFSIKEPKVNIGSPNGYTQMRNVLKITQPKVLSNGNSTLNSVTVNLGTDVETSNAEISELLQLASQVLTESSFDDFWQNQSVE